MTLILNAYSLRSKNFLFNYIDFNYIINNINYKSNNLSKTEYLTCEWIALNILGVRRYMLCKYGNINPF